MPHNEIKKNFEVFYKDNVIVYIIHDFLFVSKNLHGHKN
jgi:hypothetical protein